MATNILKNIIIVLSFVIGNHCLAQSNLPSALGVSAKRTVLKTFLDAEGRQKGPQIDVAVVVFPAPIYERSPAGYVRTKVDGKDVWLDPDQLMLDARVDAKCLVTKGQAPALAGVLRGANEACK